MYDFAGCMTKAVEGREKYVLKLSGEHRRPAKAVMLLKGFPSQLQ